MNFRFPLRCERGEGAEGLTRTTFTVFFWKLGIGILVLLLLAWPAAVQAQFTCELNNGAITITGMSPNNWWGPVVIPDTIGGLPVTSIGDWAFSWVSLETGQNSYQLTSVTIPDTVTNIGQHAFSDSPILTSVSIGKGLTSIGDGAFVPCPSLQAITVDALNTTYSTVDSVLFNKNQTTLALFPGGRTGNYTIPDSVGSIGDAAFACSSLSNITIPDSVVSIGAGAFGDCTRLSNITIPDGVASIGHGWTNYPARFYRIRSP